MLTCLILRLGVERISERIMQFALVNGRRSEARTGERGTCPDCGAAMLAKCGTRVMHHWAHASRRNCDPWWENETNWHREWKSKFPEECREVSHTAPDGEIHRADIKTPTGIVIEVQHSTMTDQERESRESFYRNLIWILDGRSFRKSFHLGCMLPDPRADGFQDIVWSQCARSAYRLSPTPIEEHVPSFWRISETAKEFLNSLRRIFERCLHQTRSCRLIPVERSRRKS